MKLKYEITEMLEKIEHELHWKTVPAHPDNEALEDRVVVVGEMLALFGDWYKNPRHQMLFVGNNLGHYRNNAHYDDLINAFMDMPKLTDLDKGVYDSKVKDSWYINTMDFIRYVNSFDSYIYGGQYLRGVHYVSIESSDNDEEREDPAVLYIGSRGNMKEDIENYLAGGKKLHSLQYGDSLFNQGVDYVSESYTRTELMVMEFCAFWKETSILSSEDFISKVYVDAFAMRINGFYEA